MSDDKLYDAGMRLRYDGPKGFARFRILHYYFRRAMRDAEAELGFELRTVELRSEHDNDPNYYRVLATAKRK